MRYRLFCVVLLLPFLQPCPAATAETPADLFQTTVFEAGQNDVTLYRIPGVAVTTRGTILAWCEIGRAHV